MNLTVLGAAGATGVEVVEQALAAGDHVTALARSAENLTLTNPNLHATVEGNATDRAVVSQAMKGADAVISVLGARAPVMAEATHAVGGRSEKRVLIVNYDVALPRRRA